MTEEPGRLRESLSSFRSVFANRNLRRLQLAWAGSSLGTWAYGIALAVFAYQEGGAVAVGVVGLIRWIPAAIVAPFMGMLGDRYPRRRVMICSDLGRVVVIGLAAGAIVADLASAVVFALAAAGVVISTAFRPAQAALIPRLATNPQELAASNVVSSTIEASGIFAGPAIGGLVLAISGPAAVFTLSALTFLWSAVLIARIRTDADAPTPHEGADPPTFGERIGGGFRAISGDADTRLLIGLFSAQTVVAGALTVLAVVVAKELLGRGDAWVGILSASLGVGGIVGAGISAARVGRNRLALDFGAGVALWGIPLIAIGLVPEPIVAIAGVAAIGIGNTIVDVAGDTLLQRSVPDEVLARVFGVLETLILLTVAAGAITAPALVSTIGARGALIVTGAFLPVVVALRWKKLVALDRGATVPRRDIELLRGLPFFSPLPEAVVEHLAGRLESFRLPAGASVFAQGDPGDRFFVVAEGRVRVVKDGLTVAEVPPGGAFGEVALLHDVPRTAGVTAIEDVELLALDGADFVAAVTGHAPSLDAADAVVRSYGFTNLPR